MLAARLHEGAECFTVEEVPIPLVGPAEALVRVHACGICGSDLHIIDGLTPTPYKPITLGHEPAGSIAATGSDVTGFGPGDRVFVNPMLQCGECDYCRAGRPHICARRRVLGIHRDGALAEYVVVPAANLLELPIELGFEEAAMIESASTPYHALTARAPVGPGDAVAIVGVGGLGLHAVQIARALGAEVIVAVDAAERPLERALALGATHAVDVRETDPVAAIRSITGDGVDVALECVGRAESSEVAIGSVRPGGIAALAGIGGDSVQLPPTTIFARTEIEVRGVYGYSQDETREVARLMVDGAIDARAAISETYPLDRVNDGLQSFRDKRTSPVRVMIRP
jgi:propanol-preferring alcohol dehydrogenase